MADAAPIGHNSIEGKKLTALIERVETLNEEKAAIAEDIREVFAEAKGNGFDAKVMRRIIQLRKQDAAERQEFAELMTLYMHALGMSPSEAAEASGMFD